MKEERNKYTKKKTKKKEWTYVREQGNKGKRRKRRNINTEQSNHAQQQTEIKDPNDEEKEGKKKDK